MVDFFCVNLYYLCILVFEKIQNVLNKNKGLLSVCTLNYDNSDEEFYFNSSLGEFAKFKYVPIICQYANVMLNRVSVNINTS